MIRAASLSTEGERQDEVGLAMGGQTTREAAALDDAEGGERAASGLQERAQCCGHAGRWKSAKAWLLKWHLPLMLVFALLVGYIWPAPGSAANDVDLGGVCFNGGRDCVWNSIGSLCVTIIFLISGMKLKTDAIRKAITAWQATLFGVVMILFVTPLISFALVTIEFATPEFASGLALFFAMPTTLSSGPIIAAQAKGNVALALMLTVLTNVLGVFTAPIFVTTFLDIFLRRAAERASGTTVQIDLEAVPMILKLVFTILVPLAIGKALRGAFQAVRDFSKDWGLELKLLSSVLLALIPWMKVSESAESFRNVDGVSFVLMWLLGIAVHVLFLAINYVGATYVLRLDLPEKAAVVIVASQKTLPVAMTILEFFPAGVVGAAGLIAIPVIVSHLMQILIDSVVASRFEAAASADPEPEEVDASGSAGGKPSLSKDSSAASERGADAADRAN